MGSCATLDDKLCLNIQGLLAIVAVVVLEEANAPML